MDRRELLRGAVALWINQGRLDPAVKLIETAVASGEVGAAALSIRQGKFRLDRGFGAAANDAESVFLLASITKPMTATAVMMLSDRGDLSIHDPVQKFLPEFRGDGREKVTIKHLLTHTSGLPDMLPDNTELRRRHAPLSEFVKGAVKVPLLFEPGTQVHYQSMGVLLAAEIVERIARQPLRDFLAEWLFLPLGMTKSSLGLGGRMIAGTMQSQVPERSDWDWNSPYWRDFGAPWGGAHASAPDVIRFLDLFAIQHGASLLKKETAAAMIANQTAPLPDARGLGWMRQPGTFGKKCSPLTFGHYGSTGTVAWADPKSQLRCVLLTTRPAAQSRAHLLGPVSDAVSEAAA